MEFLVWRLVVMYRRLIVYEAQMEEKGKDAKNLIIELRIKDNGMLIYVERHTTLEVKMGQLIIHGKDWSQEEAMEIAEEAMSLSDELKFASENVRPQGIGIVHYENGGHYLVWNCETITEAPKRTPTDALTLAKA